MAGISGLQWGLFKFQRGLGSIAWRKSLVLSPGFHHLRRRFSPFSSCFLSFWFGFTGYHLSPLNTISVIDYHHRMNIHIHALLTHAIRIHTPYSFYTYTSMQNRGLVAIGILGHGESSGLRLFSGPGLFSYLLFVVFLQGLLTGEFLFFVGYVL